MSVLSISLPEGGVWPDSGTAWLLHLQLDPHLEQWLQAHNSSALLWAGHHVAGPEAELPGSQLSGLPQPYSPGLPGLGARLPSQTL